MAAPRKYGEEIRNAIHELFNEQNRTGEETLSDLAGRFEAVPSLERLREIAREERALRKPDLATKPKDQQLQALISGVVKAVNLRLEAANGHTDDVDGAELLQLARTIREIEPLLKPEASKHGDDSQPKTLLEQLQGTQRTRTRNQEPNTHTPVPAPVAPGAGVGSDNMAA
jgi:hypothetical protein